MQLHDHLIAARHRYGQARLQAITDADICLDQLRQYLYLAWEWQWLSNGQYQHVCAFTDEIGRLLGGWRRSIIERKRTAPRQGQTPSPGRGAG